MSKLKPCRDCNTPISRRAKVCPQCGLKKPHQGAFTRGLNDLAKGLLALGLLVILVPLLGMCVLGAFAGDHRHVAGDRLWPQECFILEAPKTRMWVHRHVKTAGAWNVPRNNIVCVDEVDRSGPQPWFKVRVMQTGTLDRSRHIAGWIDSRGLMEHGVTLAY